MKYMYETMREQKLYKSKNEEAEREDISWLRNEKLYKRVCWIKADMSTNVTPTAFSLTES